MFQEEKFGAKKGFSTASTLHYAIGLTDAVNFMG
jgi:hypothetical protein